MLKATNRLTALIAGYLTQAVASPGPAGGLTGSYAALITAATKLDPTTDIGDLTEASFTGYARKALTGLGTPYLTSDGRYAQDFSALNWEMTDAVAPNIIIGYAIMSLAVAGHVLAFEVFAAPVNLTTAGQGFSLLPRVEVPPTADWGEASVAA